MVKTYQPDYEQIEDNQKIYAHMNVSERTEAYKDTVMRLQPVENICLPYGFDVSGEGILTATPQTLNVLEDGRHVAALGQAITLGRMVKTYNSLLAIRDTLDDLGLVIRNRNGVTNVNDMYDYVEIEAFRYTDTSLVIPDSEDFTFLQHYHTLSMAVWVDKKFEDTTSFGMPFLRISPRLRKGGHRKTRHTEIVLDVRVRYAGIPHTPNAVLSPKMSTRHGLLEVTKKRLESLLTARTAIRLGEPMIVGTPVIESILASMTAPCEDTIILANLLLPSGEMLAYRKAYEKFLEKINT